MNKANNSINNKLANIEKIVRTNKRYLKERYRVKQLGVFGSYLHGDQKANSDVDLLVEFDGPIGFFDFIRLENELTRLLGTKVDLVIKDSLKPRLRDRIIKEALYL